MEVYDGTLLGFLMAFPVTLSKGVEACSRLKMSFGRFIAFPLFRNHVNKNRTRHVFNIIKNLYKLRYIMSVYRSEISKTKSLEKHSWCNN